MSSPNSDSVKSRKRPYQDKKDDDTSIDTSSTAFRARRLKAEGDLSTNTLKAVSGDDFTLAMSKLRIGDIPATSKGVTRIKWSHNLKLNFLLNSSNTIVGEYIFSHYTPLKYRRETRNEHPDDTEGSGNQPNLGWEYRHPRRSAYNTDNNLRTGPKFNTKHIGQRLIVPSTNNNEEIEWGFPFGGKMPADMTRKYFKDIMVEKTSKDQSTFNPKTNTQLARERMNKSTPTTETGNSGGSAPSSSVPETKASPYIHECVTITQEQWARYEELAETYDKSSKNTSDLEGYKDFCESLLESEIPLTDRELQYDFSDVTDGSKTPNGEDIVRQLTVSWKDPSFK